MTAISLLCCSGHDPTGGAGVQADIEAAAAQQVHALTLITALTSQNTSNVLRVQPVAAAQLREQADLLLSDCRPAAIKLGLIGELAQLPVLAEIIRRVAGPVVLDPILRAGGGASLLTESLIAGLKTELLPLTTVLTPNAAEARRLADCDDLAEAGKRLLAAGVANVLITGGDEAGDQVVNLWCRPGLSPLAFRWPRIPGHFHGAGCTLASALAARLALGEPLEQALRQAQQYTHETLRKAVAVGQGRWIPGRYRVGRP